MTTQNSKFQIYFGGDVLLDKSNFTTLTQVFEVISENLFMFENDCFQFSENSITVEIATETNTNEDYTYTYEKLFKIPVAKFNLIKKMHLGI